MKVSKSRTATPGNSTNNIPHYWRKIMISILILTHNMLYAVYCSLYIVQPEDGL